MTTISIKGLSIGATVSLIVLYICYSLLGIGGGPCNAGIGIFYAFFLFIISLVIAAAFIVNPSPVISLAAKTVLITILVGLFISFIVL